MSEEVSTRTLSAAALAYLFANEIVAADTAMSRGAKVPCTEAKVKMRPSGRARFARESAAEKLFRGVDHPMVTLQRAEAVPGLPGELLNALVVGEAVGVTEAVKRWFGGLHPDPDRHVLNAIGRELVELGYADLEQSKGKRLAKRMLSMDAFNPRCERIQEARPAFDAFAAECAAFGSAEPALRAALVKKSGKAIASSTDNSD